MMFHCIEGSDPRSMWRLPALRGKEILDNFGEYLPKFKKVLSR